MKPARISWWEINLACVILAIGSGLLYCRASANVAVALSNQIRPGMPVQEAEELIKESGFRVQCGFGSAQFMTTSYFRPGNRIVYITSRDTGQVLAVRLDKQRAYGGIEGWLGWITSSDRE